MAFCLNFSRFRNSSRLIHYYKGNWQRKWPNNSQRLTIKHSNFEALNRTLFKTFVILSHKSKYLFKSQKSKAIVRDEEKTDFFIGTREAILILARIFVIGSIVTGLFIVYLVTRFTHPQVFPTILRKGIEFLGPIFVKFGQWASTRRDLFPKNVCDTLSELQQNNSPHSWAYTKHVLRTAYGTNWRDAFVKFENNSPIGSGCCAQVYKAWVDLDAALKLQADSPEVSISFLTVIEYLRLGSLLTFLDKTLGGDDEIQHSKLHSRKLQPVAVKVLHPGIKSQLRRDLSIMRGVCKYATYVIPQLHWLSLTDCIDEFSRIMNNQLDMNTEANNLTRFSENFSDNKNIIFPVPYKDFTRRDILVETFHEGSPISDFLEIEDPLLQSNLAKMGITTVLKMVFKDNFIHCDLHPGNILVENDYTPQGRILAAFWNLIGRKYKGNNVRLIILDCGLVVSLNDRCRKNLRNIFRSLLMGNGELAAEYILQHNPQIYADPDGFKNSIKDIVNYYLQNENNVNVSTVVSKLFSAMVRHRVKQDGSFSSVILSVIEIESLGRSLDPNIDIFAEVLPFIFTSS